MVEFTEFMSVFLNQCGSSEADFAAGVEVWNSEKETIRDMTITEVRENLTCP